MKLQEQRKQFRDDCKNEYRTIFSRKLYSSVISNGTTNKELASKCQVSQNSISGYINGSKLPTLVTVLNLADTLNVSLDDLFGRTGDYKPIENCPSRNALKIKKLQERIAKLMAEEEEAKEW